MSVRLRNLTDQKQTVTIVKSNTSYDRVVFPQNYLLLSDVEYNAIHPALMDGVWEIVLNPLDITPTPAPTPLPPGIVSTDQLPEGNINLYFRGTRVLDAVDVVNVGTGTGLFKQKLSGQLQFHSLLAGSNVSLTTVGNDIVLDVTGGGGGEANTASNSSSGTGTGLLYKGKAGVDLIFKRLRAGTNITITNGADDVTIDATGGGSGETNTASNSPSGSGTGLLFKGKIGVDLVFKRLLAGANISLSNGADDVTIVAAVPSPSSIAGVDIAGTGSIGSSADYALADHTHKGVYTVKKSGAANIYGTLTLSEGSNITLTQVGNDIAIAATGGGAGTETQVLSFLGGTVTIRASGSLLNLAAVSATKDFATSGESHLVLNLPSGVVYHSVNVTFTASETVGRTTASLQATDMNNSTTLSNAMRPLGMRLNATYGTGAVSSTFALVSGSTFITSLSGYTAGAEQKAAFYF